MAKRKPRRTLSQQFREHVCRYVRNCGLSQAEVGRQAGIERSMFNQFIAGTKFLGVEKLDALAELLGIELTFKEQRRGKS